MNLTCLLCDTLFSIDAFDTPQTSYLMCPECRDKARATAKAETPPSVKKKHNRKRGGNQVSLLQKTLKAQGVNMKAKDIRKAFPTAADSAKATGIGT